MFADVPGYVYNSLHTMHPWTVRPDALPSGKEAQEKLDDVLLKHCSAVTEAKQLQETVSTFIAGIMSKTEILTTPLISVFDLGAKLGWSTDDARRNELIAALAVEVAAEEGVDISDGSEQEWITRPFPMQSILKRAFLMQGAHEDTLKKSSKRYAAAQKRQMQITKSEEAKRKTDNALSRARAWMEGEEEEEEREARLAKRNATNRRVMKVKKARVVRAADRKCGEEAWCGAYMS